MRLPGNTSESFKTPAENDINTMHTRTARNKTLYNLDTEQIPNDIDREPARFLAAAWYVNIAPHEVHAFRHQGIPL